MALSKDQLKISVVLDAKGAEIGFKDLQGNLKNLRGDVLLMDESFLFYEANVAEVSKKTAAAFSRSAEKIANAGRKLVTDQQRSQEKIASSERKLAADQEKSQKRTADIAEQAARKISDTQIREAQKASAIVVSEQKKIEAAQSKKTQKADTQNSQAISSLGGGNAATLLDGQTTSLLKLSAALALAQQGYRALSSAFDSTAGKAIAIETQIARINTVLGKAEKGTIDFTRVLLDQQKAFGTDTADTARGIYEAISSGAVDGAGAVNLLAVAQKLAIGGVTSLENSVNVLTNTMNAYGFAVSDAEQISDTLFIAAAGGKTTIAELATQLGDVTGIAKTAGITFDDLAVAVSAVTTSGQSTSIATTGVRAVIAELLTPTKNLQAALTGLGITSVESAIKQKGFVGVLRELSNAYGNNASALAGLFSRVEALPAIAALVKDGTGNAFDSMKNRIQTNMSESVKISEESFGEIAKTSEFKLKQAKGSVDTTLIGIGNSFKNKTVEIAADLATSLERIIAAFEKISDSLGNPLSKISTAISAAFDLKILGGTVLGNSTSIISAFDQIAEGINRVTGAKKLMDQNLAATVKISSGADALALFQKTAPKNLQAPEFVGPAAPKNLATTQAAFNKVEADEFSKTLEEIRKKTEDYQKQVKEVGLESIKSYQAQQAEQLRVINKTQDQAKALGLLRGPFIKVFEDAKNAAINYFNALKSNEAKKTLEDLQKSVYSLTVESMKAGTDERSSIDLTLQLRLRESAALEKKYTDLIRINPLIGQQIQATRDLVAAEAQRAKTALTGITESQQTEINKALEESSKIQEEIFVKSLRATQQIDYATNARLKEIDALDAQLAVQQSITQDAVKLFEIEQARRNLGQAKQDIVASSTAQKSALPLGGALPDFTQLTALVTDMMGSIEGLINVVQSMIDFIPNILNKIANIFTSLTELPAKIFEAITGLFSAVVDFVGNFLSNIGEFIPKIIDAVITFLYDGLPKAFQGLVAKIPDIISGLIDSIGPLISKLVEGLVSAGPLLMISLIKSLPKLIISFITMIPKITIQLVKGLVSGLINAITGIGDAVADLFSSGITSGVESAGTAISSLGSGITSQLFSVGEFAAESNAGKKASEFSAAISEGTQKSMGFLKKTWDALLKGLTFVWDGLMAILKGTWDIIVSIFKDYILAPLKAIWDFIVVLFDSLILKPLRAIWNFVKTLFDDPIKAFKDLWTFVSTMFDPIINAFKKLWDSLVTIFEPIINALKGVWEMVKSGFMSIINIFKAVWDFVKTVFDAPIAAFRAIWDFVKTVFDSPLEAFRNLFTALGNIGANIWEKIKGIGGVIWDSIKGAFKSVGNILSDLFTIDWKGMGTVERFLGIDFPWLNFAGGGIVPGQARVYGDSASNDTRPALLSPGEAVIPRSIMQDPVTAKLIHHLLNGDKPKQHVVGYDPYGVSGSSAGASGPAYRPNTSANAPGTQRVDPNSAAYAQQLQDLYASGRNRGSFGNPFAVFTKIAKAVAAPVIQVVKAVTPKWILDLFDSLKMIGAQSLDIGKLISDPKGYVTGILKSIGSGLIKAPAKALLGGIGRPMATGGMVPGTGDRDSFAAMLTPGEFVLNKRATQNIGGENLRVLNSGGSLQTSQSSAPIESTVNVVLNLTSGGMMDANYIRDKLMPAIKDELRKESRRGGYIIATAGVRS